jgi:hypothetical protein
MSELIIKLGELLEIRKKFFGDKKKFLDPKENELWWGFLIGYIYAVGNNSTFHIG